MAEQNDSRDGSERPRKPRYTSADSGERRASRDTPRDHGSGRGAGAGRQDNERRYSGDRPQYDRKPYGDRGQGERRSYGDRPQTDRKPYGDRSHGERRTHSDRKPYGDRGHNDRKPYGDGSQGERRSYGDRSQQDRKPYGDRGAGERRSYGDRSQQDRKPYGDRGQGERRPYGDRPQQDRKPYGDRGHDERRSYGNRPQTDRKPYGDRGHNDRKPYGDRGHDERRSYGDRPQHDRKPYGDRGHDERRPYGDRPQQDRKPYGDRNQGERRSYGDRPLYDRKPYGDRGAGERRSYGDRPHQDRKPYGDRSYGDRGHDERRTYGDRPHQDRKPYGNRGYGDRGQGERRSYGDRPQHDRKPYGDHRRDDRNDERASRPPQSSERRIPAPDLPDDITPRDLNAAARNELKTLSKENAEAVARHLAMAAILIDENPALAHEHALAASRRAGRVAVVRETVAITAYAVEDYALALRELRTYRRISGKDDQIALIVDSERGMGRPDRAIEEGRSVDRAELPAAVRVDLAIALSGARLDLGETERALIELDIPELDPDRAFEWSPALFSARAAVLEELGRTEEAAEWQRRAVIAAEALDAASGFEEGADEVVYVEELEEDDVADEFLGEEADADEADDLADMIAAVDGEGDGDAAGAELEDIGTEAVTDSDPAEVDAEEQVVEDSVDALEPGAEAADVEGDPKAETEADED